MINQKYYAYGSNMDAEQMLKRCPQSIFKEKETLSGYQFFINKRGYASIRKKKNSQVWGIIYNISVSDEASLDRYEEYPKIYGKLDLPELKAFCYIDLTPEEGLPKTGYLEKIIKSSQLHSFPKEYIAELKSWLK